MPREPGRSAIGPARSGLSQSPQRRSREQSAHDVPMHIRQTEIPPRVSIRQPFVVQPQQVQHRRVQVVDVDGILHRAETKLIGRAIHRAALHPPPPATR